MSDARGLYTTSETLFTSGAWSVLRATDAEGRAVRFTTLQLPPGLSSGDLESLAAAMSGAVAACPASQGSLQVRGGGLTDGELWLAESAPAGPSLRETLASSGPMEADHIVPFLHQVAAALHPLHAAGLAHIWLSPDNVYPQPSAVLGGQVWAGVLSHLRQISPATAWPEADFVAPEALAGPSNGTRAEVYSAAALATFAAAGRAPTAIGSNAMPPALQAALSRGLAPDPAARYRGVKEMVVDVTVEQAIAMEDSAERVAVPAGGDVPDWARELLQQTEARRDAGQALLDTVPTAPVAPTAPSGLSSPAAHAEPGRPGAAPSPGAPRIPPPPPVASGAPKAPETRHRDQPVEPANPAFQWSDSERPRSLVPTVMAVVSILFILAAIALTFMKR